MSNTEYMSATEVLRVVPFHLTHFLLHKLEAEVPDFPKSVRFGDDESRRYFRRDEIMTWLKAKFGDGHISIKEQPSRARPERAAPRKPRARS